jgi:hypothetical protein
MGFSLVWADEAADTYNRLRSKAKASLETRTRFRKKKSTRDEGLFKQVAKCISLLKDNPRHPGLHTHPYVSIENPYDRRDKLFEAYAQSKTPGAYRVFWCYGPNKGEITIIAITPHP